ncbi:ankyrin repeat domain-containing protein [Methylomonas sp. ZR1]|uniref:ankyrin repeat domain-containing protein n=1 Tax=Methylomonas sp. ZR1 TaxID=1797072 RepID=UPI001492A9E7|nr:ankyrin repeat domain-containing protein [Methylomonas sp. ZR1]NOV32518.1 ankyrin repeat domain-containing protein [Methylomonas sp. ZR1]
MSEKILSKIVRRDALRIGVMLSVLQVGSVCAVDVVQARKDLQQMGVEYTEQQFATSAGAGDMAAVRLFLDAGMDINAGDSAALGLAAGRGRTEMVELLLANGAKPTANALQFARARGHREIANMLLRAGAKE